MKLAPLALLTLAAAVPAAQGPSRTVREFPDFTIKTRTTFGGQHAASQTVVLQLKGARQRVAYSIEGPAGIPAAGSRIHITQCDTRRSLFVNDKTRLYASVPIPEETAPLPLRGATFAPPGPDTRPIAETITVDAVDTGERRPMGPFAARRVVTTTTTERHEEGHGPTRTSVRDGWYLDLPFQPCGDASGGYAFAILTGGDSSGRTELKWKGTARTGWPVIETDRSTDAHGTIVRTTSVTEFSAAPLDPALFEVPQGYRPALPLGNGGFDLETPDTVVNRVRLVVENAASWVHYTWSHMRSRSRSSQSFHSSSR